MDLDKAGPKITAYADDLVLLIRGKFMPTISEITESSPMLGSKNGLGVNPNEDRTSPTYESYTIPSLQLPRLQGKNYNCRKSELFRHHLRFQPVLEKDYRGK